ncbi:MAG: hypothetical protein P0Y49_15910 [Candidatus Pedobacter colombiensis]|uniref:Uncharacterized protein n=1 Tax=Candidatus Pedobacter colombiensis TaxID=3121371 RepID=A0AAJ5W5E2_9SPHI|nr:hypothetical protein [Pedobacter sp.]WEK18277.1 MAG: hypothetical protein P0Y49_15910 [Pedobacter sp.]
MRLTIKNAEAVYINPALRPSRLNVDITEIELHDVLFQVDINQAISYYGITELLDAIGDQEIRSHLLDLERQDPQD